MVEEITSYSTKSRKEELRWQAPECLNGGHASLASDVYSLGMCIIYVISGKPPWGSYMSDSEIKHEVCSQHRIAPRPHEFSDNEWKLVNGMCEYDPRKRITIGDAVQQLSKLIPAEFVDIPEWRVQRCLVVYSDDVFSESNLVSRHAGRWKDAVVAVETIKQAIETPKHNFGRVADLWFSLKHPAILQLFRACDDCDDQFFVCEYAELGDFNTYLRKSGEISEKGAIRKQIWTILLDVALALKYLHSIGIVHGDVNFQNILIGQDGHGKLSGFISSFKHSFDAPEEEPATDSEYNIPSCVNGHHVGYESDVYWLGQCIVSAFWEQSIADNRADPAVRCDVCITNPLLHRPNVFTRPEWQLIQDMCAVEPSHRIEMPEVVESLARIIAVDAVVIRLASGPPPTPLDYSKRNRGQTNLLTVMSEYTISGNVDADYDEYDFDDSSELTPVSKDGVLKVKFQELTQVDSFDRSAEDAIKEHYRGDLGALLNAEEQERSNRQGLLMTPSQPRKRFGRLRSLPPKPFSPKWSISTDHVAESTWRDSDIGFGSYAEVCRGTWLGASVALKKLRTFDLKSAQKLREEAHIWFALRHPNIVCLFGACTKGYPLFVCEYIDGKRLDECQVGVEVSKEQMWGYLHDAAVGLQGLHLHGVVHADLKGDNILIGANGRAKLIDFGLSCLRMCDGGEPRGALPWKAPECIAGAGPTFESDVYGFGMCIIQAFSGHCPWGRCPDNAVKILLRSGRLPKTPVTLKELEWEAVRKMCCQDPQARLTVDLVVRVVGFFAGRQPYIDDTTLQKEITSWKNATK
ncbi:serine/threonine protein kinase [Phytophthora nicotianae]|uniref:Serine/threonine protein kinase n=1 Tax=Phytophthora nicotianae TaxID=4792 RepID=W2FTP3_PHYNI|nr:serine/threonine protein kinase [Phytophthora nicotianae]